MKFDRLFFLENLKKTALKSDFLIFFKFQPMSAKQWFSLRTVFKQKKLDLVILKKREVLRVLGIRKDFLSLDTDNICFVSSTNFFDLYKILYKSYSIENVYLRPFLFRLNYQFLSFDYLINLFPNQVVVSADKIFFSNFMSFETNLYCLKLNLFSNTSLLINIKILSLKE